jgi:hypothetical protein
MFKDPQDGDEEHKFDSRHVDVLNAPQDIGLVWQVSAMEGGDRREEVAI